MNELNYIELIAQYLSKNTTKAEEATLMEWIEQSEENKTLFEETKQVWETAEVYKDEFPVDTQGAWGKVEQKLNLTSEPLVEEPIVEKETKHIQLPIYKQLMRIAAVFLVGLGIGYWWISNSTKVQDDITNLVAINTIEEEEKEVVLPDGSKVWLNENSSLTYNKSFDIRTVNLKGEAFFDVEHIEGKRFTIKSGQSKTEVLGTSFNVRAYDDEENIEVTVVTGTVAFSEEKKETERVVLTKGNVGLLHKQSQKVNKKTVKTPNTIAWKTKRFEFEDTPLKDVIKALERYFEVEIKTTNNKILNCQFQGSYKDPKIEEILEAVAFGSSLNLSQIEGVYTLAGEGCQ